MQSGGSGPRAADSKIWKEEGGVWEREREGRDEIAKIASNCSLMLNPLSPLSLHQRYGSIAAGLVGPMCGRKRERKRERGGGWIRDYAKEGWEEAISNEVKVVAWLH